MVDVANQASLDQTQASDPSISAWVSANAGSGKTHVLVNRVIRLLLTGTPPEKILCLTYTRAAAAEMSTRLYDRLAEWIPLDDEALIEKIHKNTGHTRFDKDQLAKPRRLFAQALETPGGLKIQTIHAFCEQLLHRFPIEAGITGKFKVLEERDTTELRKNIRSGFFAEIERSKDPEINGFLTDVIKYSSGQKGFDDLLKNLLSKRDELWPVYQDIPAVIERLATTLQIDQQESVENIYSNCRQHLDRETLSGVQQTLQARRQKTDTDQAERLQKALVSETSQEVFEHLKSLTLTARNTPKSSSKLCTKTCAEENPQVLTALEAEAARMVTLVDNIKAVGVLTATTAILHIGKAITDQYEVEKNRLGVFDYDDLIARVLVMFARLPDAAWVLYKLDGGLDHILIDEAQDTSPAQWNIIQFLADDFFSGEGARQEFNRSIFAVGDHKQSIYSFQGADPGSFNERKQYFRQAVEQSGQIFRQVDFLVSFRSTQQVLNLVDDVFNQEEAAKGVDNAAHSAVRLRSPGLVELWPVEEIPQVKKSSVWLPESRTSIKNHPRVRLAEKTARKISSWLKNGEMLYSENRPIEPRDILILVRQRTQLMDALVRALKLANVPVAGVDRLKLTQHIGVQDLMALARFVLLPEDDLNFAGLLKSSLLEKDDNTPFNDDDLTSIASQRGQHSVWQSFQDQAAAGAPYNSAKILLDDWQELAQKLLPFELFSNVLSKNHKRVAMLKRLGSEASEPVDAFLSMVQEFEQSHIPTLQGLLAWIESGETEIKREMEKNDNAVRIMTVHGAKGLESKIVILPDTCDVPNTGKAPAILNAGHLTPVWRLKSSLETNLIGDLKNSFLTDSLDEHNRLLYVAMTRACDRLYIGGAQSNKTINKRSWYQLVANILGNSKNQVSDDVFGTVWRASQSDLNNNDEKQVESKFFKPPASLPGWISKAPPQLSKESTWITPSTIGNELPDRKEQTLSPLTGSNENRFLRGNLIHRMLQYLPEVPREKQIGLAEKYIADHGSSLSNEEQTNTLVEVEKILIDEKFAPVFAPGSLAEVPIVARIEGKSGESLLLHGQIDRLCISNNEILMVDYKTNKLPPDSTTAVNHQYIRQLAAYRLALLEIYPGRTIHAGLLWTNNAVLMEIDERRLIDIFSFDRTSNP